MGSRYLVLAAVLSVAVAGVSWGATITIGPNDLDPQVVYSPTKSGEFENPAEVDFGEVLKATEEATQVKRKGIKKGTGEYWILMNRANERIIRSILVVSQEKDYDLVVRKGGLKDIEPSVKPIDATDEVIEELENRPGARSGFSLSKPVDPDMPVLALGAGKVIASLDDPKLGQTVKLDVGNGVEVWYIRMAERSVKKDAAVTEGQVLGKSADKETSKTKWTEMQIHLAGQEGGGWIQFQ